MLILGILVFAFGAAGSFLTWQIKKTQPGIRRPSRPKSETLRTAARRKGAPADPVHGPRLTLPDPDRRVGIADVRLLQRFGAGVDYRRVLGPFHSEVDPHLPEGTPVILCVDCQGTLPETVELDLDGQPASLEHDPGAGDAEIRRWIRYAYSPGHHGEPMYFRLRYRDSRGTLTIDQYQTRHGFRELDFLETTSNHPVPALPASGSSPSLQSTH